MDAFFMIQTIHETNTHRQGICIGGTIWIDRQVEKVWGQAFTRYTKQENWTESFATRVEWPQICLRESRASVTRRVET